MFLVIHCWIKPGGALNVLEALILKKIRSGQSVDVIFTMYSDRDFLEIGQVISEEVGNNSELLSFGTSKLVKIPIITALPRWLNAVFRRADRTKPRYISSIIDYRNLMPFFPLLMRVLSKKVEKLRSKGEKEQRSKGEKEQRSKGLNDKKDLGCFQTFDTLISSYAVAKNIDLPPGTHTEIYFHQPMHYIWTLYDEYVGSMTGRKKRLYASITPYLRRRDSKPRQYDIIYANSENTKQQIEKIYGLGEDRENRVAGCGRDVGTDFGSIRPIQVVHPPIDQTLFHKSVVTVPDNYFFYINRLTKLFKHLDKIILMCNHYKIPLLIAGDGPDKEYLMSIAGPTITFLGRVSKVEDKIRLLSRSRGVINIAHESFGIVTAEALLLGVPIFGYQGGATPELVDERSGILTPGVDSETMYPLFEEFVQHEFDRQAIQDRARVLLGEGQRFWAE